LRIEELVVDKSEEDFTDPNEDVLQRLEPKGELSFRDTSEDIESCYNNLIILYLICGCYCLANCSGLADEHCWHLLRSWGGMGMGCLLLLLLIEIDVVCSKKI